MLKSNSTKNLVMMMEVSILSQENTPHPITEQPKSPHGKQGLRTLEIFLFKTANLYDSLVRTTFKSHSTGIISTLVGNVDSEICNKYQMFRYATLIQCENSRSISSPDVC